MLQQQAQVTTDRETGRLVARNPLMDEVAGALQRSHLSLAVIAERAEVNSQTLNNWVNHKVFMPRKLMQVLDVLGYEVTLRRVARMR